MYTTASQVWSGLAKNATEGLADPARIVPVSIVLFLGQILPFLVFLCTIATLLVYLPLLWHHAFIWSITNPPALFSVAVLLPATMLTAWFPRILSTMRFKQNWRSAALHPIGILTLLLVQWYSLIRKLSGAPVAWRDRTYTPTPTDTPAA
jgi:hypothetical protein